MDPSSCIRNVGKCHIESFNYVVNSGVQDVCNGIDPVFTDENIKISISKAVLKKLQYPMDLRKHRRIVYPSEARIRWSTYFAELHVELCFQKNNDRIYIPRIFYVPAMVKSNLCYLNGLSDDRLVEVKEDVNDPGGYFIVEGKERMIRSFVVPLRNYPLALVKTSWKTYGEYYSEFGIMVRSVKNEHIISTVSLHYVTYGSFEVRMYYHSTSYHIGVMLLMKALVDKNDLSLCREVTKFCEKFPIDQLKSMILKLQNQGICSHIDAKIYIGQLFHAVVHLPPDSSTLDVANYVLRKSLFVHLDSFEDKFQFLCYSLCKLHSAVFGICRPDDQDNPVNQEILAPGQTYMVALKQGITTYLRSVKNVIRKKIQMRCLMFRPDVLQKCCSRAISLSPWMVSMIATGNMPGRLEHGFPTETGYTISLKRTNVFELAAQFSAICKFSIEHYSRNRRTYYPESWGFLCPTQTPEGEKCGLYNHLAGKCKVIDLNEDKIQLNILSRFGILPCDDPFTRHCPNKYFVLVDGQICGWVKCDRVIRLLSILKMLKSDNVVPYHCEIVCMSKSQHFFPGIFLFSSPCRLIRKLLRNSTEEFIGCFEQATLTLDPDDRIPSCNYSEISDVAFLSLSAAMIPFCENNPAVRNIFSSVKCKQGFGVPYWNISGRSDSKTSQLVYGQSPAVVTQTYLESGFTFYPHGANVIVAVLSYSGFDMEDALTLNSASVQRGLMQHVTFKTNFYMFDDLACECNCNPSDIEFKRDDNDPFIVHFLDEGGFPFIGQLIRQNDPILSVYDKSTKKFLIKRYLSKERAHIHSVRLMGDVPVSNTNIPKNSKKVSITFSIKKVPAVGDKFSNRHGGKGVCSYLMPSEDLPISESGIIPDILFNPHGLPSRMSIGMLYEMGAGKADIGRGCVHVMEPFASDKVAYKTIGATLKEAGLNYYGTERFYSGTSGEELEADVFCGCMYYLCLHHIVEEKYQVRSVGPVNEKTNQPINPAKSGAIRVGEMERDAILSHGAMEIIQDRLLHNSDKCSAYVCIDCHLVLYPILPNPLPEEMGSRTLFEENKLCKLCGKESCFQIQIPYVLVYLITELAVLGIKVKLSNT